MSVHRSSDLRFADLPGRRSADPLADVAAESSIRVVELERTESRTAHRHPHTEEIVYVAAGTGEVWIDGRTIPIEPGDVVRIPAQTPHATIPDRGVSMRLVCFFPHPDLGRNIEDTDITVT